MQHKRCFLGPLYQLVAGCIFIAGQAVLAEGSSLDLKQQNLTDKMSTSKAFTTKDPGQESMKLRVTGAYMPQVPSVSNTSAIYLTIQNRSNTRLELTGASTSIAKHVMFHQSIESNGVIKMKHLSEVTIDPGKSVEFLPGGMHIMLMGLLKPLPQKEFILYLNFKHQENQAVVVSVKSRTIQ